MSLDVMKQALETLEEAVFYTSSESWSPSMTRECESAITALRAAIEQAQSETELETYKRLYELRGKALERPCSNCGHQPAKIKTMAQQAQEPVAWVGPSWLNPETRTWESESFSPKPIKGWIPLYTAPRQWQGLTDDEIVLICGECAASHADDIRYARAIEAKLREKNT